MHIIISCFAWKAFLYTYTFVAFTYISVTCAMYVCIDAVRCGSWSLLCVTIGSLHSMWAIIIIHYVSMVLLPWWSMNLYTRRHRGGRGYDTVWLPSSHDLRYCRCSVMNCTSLLRTHITDIAQCCLTSRTWVGQESCELALKRTSLASQTREVNHL